MVRPHEFITLQTLVGEEERIDPETNEPYVENIIIAEDKKLKSIIDLDSIEKVDEYTNDKGNIYSKRTMIISNGMQVVVLSPYSEVKELVFNSPKEVKGLKNE